MLFLIFILFIGLTSALNVSIDSKSLNSSNDSELLDIFFDIDELYESNKIIMNYSDFSLYFNEGYGSTISINLFFYNPENFTIKYVFDSASFLSEFLYFDQINKSLNDFLILNISANSSWVYQFF
ncbi:MAG: hypothetical protein ACMXX9_04640 [Candidatus Woesearchaeota archaeon]